MARVEIRVSDLTGEQIQDDERAARLIVEHPDYPEPIGLDVLPDEVTPHLTEENSRFVVVSLEQPDNPTPTRHVLSLSEFNDMFELGNADDAVEQAYSQQHEEQRSRRRGGRRQSTRRQQTESRKPKERINYASPEYAGLDHPGRVSEAEKTYVREHLAEVNERRRQQGQDILDPADPEVARRYSLTDEPIADTEVV
jgi:hypothetical protein